MTRRIIFPLILACHAVLLGQDSIRPPSYSDTHFYNTISLSNLSEFDQSPVFNIKDKTSNRRYNSLVLFNLVSVYWETRLNLIEINKNTSISFNLCPSVSMSSVFSDTIPSFTSEYPQKGFWALHFLSTLNFNKGFHSTYYNEDLTGFVYGLGTKLTIAPLSELRNNKLNSEYKLYWLQPVIRVGYKWERLKKWKVRYLDLTIGFANGYSARLTYGYLINYL